MNDIVSFIRQIPYEKKLHFICGFIITMIMSLFFSYGIAFMTAVLAGALKELYDYISKKGTPCWSDFSFTAAGAFIAEGLSTLLKLGLFLIF